MGRATNSLESGLREISLELSQIFQSVKKRTFSDKRISDFFILKMFVARRKCIIDNEESSDEEIVSFRRKIINKISLNSSLHDEEFVKKQQSCPFTRKSGLLLNLSFDIKKNAKKKNYNLLPQLFKITTNVFGLS